ncbi:MAG: hypothetical protein HY260_14645, partial [Chloroflexi bacterium]|nr:hypothetical protein [Chloroflexota bacterium]
MRSSAVFWGLVAIIATYLWARGALGVPAALGTVALMAVSFWPLAVSRQALRSGTLPGLFALAAWAWWRWHYKGVGKSAGGDSKLRFLRRATFPLLLAATFYTYLPARGLWVAYPLFLVYLAVLRRTPQSRVRGAPTGKANAPSSTSDLQPVTPTPCLSTLLSLTASALLALPLFYYLWTHPGAEQRLTMLDAPLQSVAHGDPSALIANVRDGLAMFFWPGTGDRFLAYNIPGKPIFEPLMFAAFLVGLGVAVRRWRQPPYAFALIWLFVGIAPSLLIGPEAATTRSIGALPAMYVFPALAF